MVRRGGRQFVFWLVMMHMLLLGDVLRVQAEESGGPPGGLGRLFTSSRERVELNQARSQALEVGRLRQEDVRSEDPQKEWVAVNGFLLRSGGPPAVWMNGGTALVASGGVLPEGVQVPGEGAGGVSVLLPGRRVHVTLWPGQRFDGREGRVLESYEAAKLRAQEMKTGPKNKRREAKSVGKKGMAGEKKGGAGSLDRYGLGAEGAALSEMTNNREQFQKRLGGMASILGH
ncbi:MAG TPA: hypothetical protein HPQ00_03725 [Magnetococcales bacterium]|nr:hypothetical protein [Magnetococcales bacterium]